MEYLPQIATVALINILAVMSPGPDFMMIARNSIMYSRRTAVLSALGLGIGILVHVTYSLVGIGFAISKSIVLFNLIKFLGAFYLIYIGYKSLKSQSSVDSEVITRDSKDLTKAQAVKVGFITNVTNPKVTLFFLSIFTLVIDPNTPLFVKLVMGAEMSLATFLWFAAVATLFTHKMIKDRVSKVQHYAEKVMGAILVMLGIKIAFDTSK